MRLYDMAPSLMTDEQIAYTIEEIDRDLQSCAKLKPGPWNPDMDFSVTRHCWQDEPENMTVHITAVENGARYQIAGTTIYNTVREGFFMAAMREEYPAALRAQRAQLAYIQELRRQLKRKRSKSR